jgi:hypothetical protein
MGSSMISINAEKLSQLKKEECKKKAQSLLESSDWADLPSNRNLLQNIEEWDKYRIEVKKLRINPIENPIFPDTPLIIWKDLEGVLNE